jgi:glycosyltransferase involved in cell wall biosynthesis
VHSRHSEASTEWFMERWGIAESYSDPLLIYKRAMGAGMSMVTITDHNSLEASLALKERYGQSVITGVESTASFPEDGCKVHVLVYGLNEREFAEIQALRKDIYELREYLRERNLAHSIAHATYSVQPGTLTVAHIEKLIVLFNVFEVINGGRNRTDNNAWRHILENLTPDCIDALSRKHALEPFDSQPWLKGFTGGSDDHGGIFIGQTFTEATGAESFLESVRRKATVAGGRHSDYQSLVFSVYKVMHDASLRGKRRSSSPLGQLAEALFEGKRMGFANRVRMKRLKARTRKGEEYVRASLSMLADGLKRRESGGFEASLHLVHSAIAEASDGFLKLLFGAMGNDMAELDLFAVMRRVQASVPGIFLALPFLFTLRHLNGNRMLIERLGSTLQIDRIHAGSRILWFTDTLKDLNGVSVTLQEVARIAHERGLELRIVTALDPTEAGALPPNVLNLPFIHEFGLPYYESYRLKVPSVLASLKELHWFEPDVIHVSTPGPIGLLGLMLAKLMNVRSVGFYHTDFTLQAREIVRDESVSRMLEAYTRWFYSAMDEIRVPTAHYATALEARGFDARKIKRFARGIDLDLFAPRPSPARPFLADRFGMRARPILLYVGRISPDKGLDFLLEVYRSVISDKEDVNLLIVGDGPYLPELRQRTDMDGVTFAGRIDHKDLPALYAASDLFLFPSTTDTFGRVVLEAQACGLPAIVSDRGGPQEIVLQGRTGLIARAGDVADWSRKVENMLSMMTEAPSLYQTMRKESRRHIIEHYDWADLEDSIFGPTVPAASAEKKIA